MILVKQSYHEAVARLKEIKEEMTKGTRRACSTPSDDENDEEEGKRQPNQEDQVMTLDRETCPEQFDQICWFFAELLRQAAANGRLLSDHRFPGPHPPEMKKHWLHCASDYKNNWQITLEDLQEAFRGGSLDNERWRTNDDDVQRMVKFMFREESI